MTIPRKVEFGEKIKLRSWKGNMILDYRWLNRVGSSFRCEGVNLY